MAVIDNTVTTEQMVAGLDREMVENFNQENDRLMEILGIFGTEVMAANTSLYQLKATGELNEAVVAEGDEVPLSRYKLEKKHVGDLTIKPYRKLTTAQAILKSGFLNAVGKTDEKMVKDVRHNIINEFFGFLKNGTGRAKGATLQAALAQQDATMNDELEKRGDSAERIIHFVNRFDIADYLAEAQVTMQTAYGMTYIQSFLGVNDLFVTSQVPKGVVYATPVDNLRIYGTDYAELAKAGLSYEVGAGGLIAVAHEPAYNRVSAQTHVLTGMTILPEVLDYIVAASIGDAVIPEPEAAAFSARSAVVGDELDDMTVARLKEYAQAHGIDLGGKTSKADILAVIKAAEGDA